MESTVDVHDHSRTDRHELPVAVVTGVVTFSSLWY